MRCTEILLVLAVILLPAHVSAQRDSGDVVLSDRARIQAHLARVEASLRATDVQGLSSSQRAAREQRLDDLHAYWTRGVFPHGSVEQPSPLSPTFIDRGGRPCAMAYLVIASGHETVAREIAIVAG